MVDTKPEGNRAISGMNSPKEIEKSFFQIQRNRTPVIEKRNKEDKYDMTSSLEDKTVQPRHIRKSRLSSSDQVK